MCGICNTGDRWGDAHDVEESEDIDLEFKLAFREVLLLLLINAKIYQTGECP